MSAAPASEKEQDGLPERSVYDILYSDNKRIGSFLSQFDENGHLEKITQNETATTAVRRGFKWSVGGGGTVVGTGGNVSVGFERGPGDQAAEGLQRVYDPLWTNVLTLLDFLAMEDLLHRDINSAAVGRFVLIRGRLSIFDMNALKGLWTIGVLKDGLTANLVQTKEATHLATNGPIAKGDRNRLVTSWKAEAASEMASNLEILNLLPHSILCSVNHDGASAWCSLLAEGLISSASDLLIKYGINITGEWAMLAVLDAKPETEGAADRLAVMASDAASLGGLWEGMTAIAPVVRAMLGRPEGSYGVTPLLIFRQVSG